MNGEKECVLRRIQETVLARIAEALISGQADKAERATRLHIHEALRLLQNERSEGGNQQVKHVSVDRFLFIRGNRELNPSLGGDR